MLKAHKSITTALLLGMALVSFPANAKENKNSCEYTNDIVALAQISANERHGYDFYGSRPYGAISAYLLERYGNLSENDALSLFETAVDSDFDNAAELLLAYQVFHADSASETDWVNLAIVNIISGESDILRGTQLSLLRAVLLKSSGDPLFQILSTNADLFQKFKEITGKTSLSLWLSDQSEEVRLDLAARFEQATLYADAIDMLLTMPSLGPLVQFIKRHQNQDWLEDALLEGSNHFYQGYVQALKHGIEEEYLERIVPEGRLTRRDEMAQIIAGEQHIRFSMMSYELLNTTDDMKYAGLVGSMINEDVQSGDFDPLQQPFRPLTILYEEYIVHSEAAFDYLGYSSPSYWKFNSNLEFLEFYTAAIALEPFVKSEAPMPEKPWPFEDSFNWQSWQSIAEAVINEDISALEQGAIHAPKVVAELLFRAGKLSEVTDLLLGMGDQSPVFELAEQFALRLDLRCQAYLDSQSLNFGKPLFVFER